MGTLKAWFQKHYSFKLITTPIAVRKKTLAQDRETHIYFFGWLVYTSRIDKY